MTLPDGNKTNLVLQLHKNSPSDSFVFSYRGPFHADLTSRFVDISENTLANQDHFKKINRKFSFLLVETFQNILKHGEKINHKNFGHFSFRNEGNILIINSINLVKNSEASKLTDLVNEINGLDQEELKESWKKQLIDGELSKKGGAGLGLLEIARKSKQKMRFKIDSLSNVIKKFHQQVIYSNDEKYRPVELDYIEKTDSINRKMRKHNVLFEYKGNVNQQLIFPMMNIVEESVLDSPNMLCKIKVASHILMEMLQNIPRKILPNGQSVSDGACIIQHKGDNLIVQTGNLIDNKEVKELKERLLELQNKSIKELKVMHVKRMQEAIGSKDKFSSKLGLIEIARYANGYLEFSFDKISNDETYFTLSARI